MAEELLLKALKEEDIKKFNTEVAEFEYFKRGLNDVWIFKMILNGTSNELLDIQNKININLKHNNLTKSQEELLFKIITNKSGYFIKSTAFLLLAMFIIFMVNSLLFIYMLSKFLK